MGLAASQARLLTLTARLSDNELRSQSINNAKMRLAAQSSQASEAYINALNNATLKFTNYDETGASLVQPLTFNALTAYSSYNTQYGLINSSGQILVSEAEADMFKAANGDLNKYLKAHGLEFTTTYFEEVGAKENPDYPEPFNYITKDDLKLWYEEYGSYENSVEVENYNLAYSNYQASKNTLTHALKTTLENYFGATGADASRTDGGYQVGTTVNGELSRLKSNYTSTSTPYSNNTYNINNATTFNFVSDTAKEAIRNLLANYSQSSITPYGLTVTNKEELTQRADGNYSFVMESLEFIVDADDNLLQIKKDYDPEDKYTYTHNAVSLSFIADSEESYATYEPVVNTKLSDFLSTFNITMKNDSSVQLGTATATYDAATKTATVRSVYTETNEIQNELKYLNQNLLNILYDNTDFGAFGEMLIKGEIYPKDSTGKITSISPSLQGQVTDFVNSKATFLNTIFTDTTTNRYNFPDKDAEGNVVYSNGEPVLQTTAKTIEEAIEDGTIVMSSLMNEEYVLSLAKMTPNLADNLSATFHTVIKTFVVNQLFEDYGTPKYAWIDQLDTGNTGNADSKAQWYTNLYKRMEKGYKALENGLASSAQWIEYALESGLVTMEQVDKSFNWQSLEFKTCTRITEVTDDAAVAKAEAEYNRAMNDIKTKDNMYDIQLKNIDTEHNSLQTEYDSIKSVIGKNIDRTFKFDQSA